MANTVPVFDLKIFQLHRVKAFELLKDTVEYLVTTFKQSRNIFTIASPFGQIIFVTENLMQLVMYYISDSITELNINEATRESSIYSLAALAGHSPTRSISASGEIALQVRTDFVTQVANNLLIIPNYTKIHCINNNLTYSIELPTDELKVSTTGLDNGKTMTIKQGFIETQLFTGTGENLQSYSVQYNKNFFVDQFTLDVYVNGLKWTKYDSFYDMPRGANTYIVKTGMTSGVDLFFGNGNFGLNPPLGSDIRIEYLVTEGGSGNIDITQNPKGVFFTFVDTGFDQGGNEIDLNEVFNINLRTPPTFGANPEPIELTRLIAPTTSKNFALVNVDNYEVLLEKMNFFSVIRVFLDATDSTNDRIINLFVIPDITASFAVSEDYYSTPLDRFTLNSFQKSKLLEYIEKSGTKLIGSDIVIIDPVISKYVINVSIIIYDDALGGPTQVKQSITSALADYFINSKRRDRIPRSDLIKLIENINDVDSVNVNIVSEKNELQYLTGSNRITQITDIGLDEFNDIIIEQNELPVIRGGWTTRTGVIFETGISDNNLSSVNIAIKKIIPRPKNL